MPPVTPPPVPLLLLSGAGDRLVNPACSAALARACGAMLDEAELKVVKLMKGPDGNPVELEFEDGNNL
jgi:hypothetical protein